MEQPKTEPVQPGPTIQRLREAQEARAVQETAKRDAEVAARMRPTIRKAPDQTPKSQETQQFVESFKEGFSFRPTAEQRVRAGTGFETLGFTLGSAAAVGVGGIGKVVGKGLSAVPGVSQVGAKIGRVLSNRGIQTQLGAIAVGDVAITGATQGREEALRKTATIGRDVAAFGGVLSGVKVKGVDAKFDVTTFQDSAVIRGRGKLDGREFTETTVTTDKGKTSRTQINVGNEIFIIERKPDVTNVKVIDANTFRTIRTFKEEPVSQNINTRIKDLKKVSSERVAEIESGLGSKVLVRETQKGTQVSSDVSAKNQILEAELKIKRVEEATTLASKPQRRVDELVRTADLTTGKVGIETIPRVREVGRVEFVEQKVDVLGDRSKITQTDTGLIVEKIAVPRFVRLAEVLELGKGEITLQTIRPLNIFESKRAQLVLPSRAPAETFITQVTKTQPTGNLRPLEFTPFAQRLKVDQPFTFVVLPESRSKKPILESPTQVEVRSNIEEKIDNKVQERFIPAKRIDVESKTILGMPEKTDSLVDTDVSRVSIQKPSEDIDKKVSFKPVQRVESQSKVLVKPRDRVSETFIPVQQPLNGRVLDVPVTPRSTRLDLDIDLGRSKPTSAFTFIVGREGRETFFTGTAQTFSEALSKGRRAVLETPAASLRIKQDEEEVSLGREEVRKLLGERFQPGKTGGVIQKREFRIASQGELKGITFKGIQSKKKNRLF